MQFIFEFDSRGLSPRRGTNRGRPSRGPGGSSVEPAQLVWDHGHQLGMMMPLPMLCLSITPWRFHFRPVLTMKSDTWVNARELKNSAGCSPGAHRLANAQPSRAQTRCYTIMLASRRRMCNPVGSEPSVRARRDAALVDLIQAQAAFSTRPARRS
jgi:hypothetical protein